MFHDVVAGTRRFGLAALIALLVVPAAQSWAQDAEEAAPEEAAAEEAAPAEEAAAEEATEEAAHPALALEGDPAAGARVFNQCRACHMVAEGRPHTVGPNLYGVFGRTAGTAEGYNRYSAPMKAKGGEGLVWSAATLAPYLTNPKDVVPGGSMAFAGLRNPQQVADVIAYLMKETGAAE